MFIESFGYSVADGECNRGNAVAAENVLQFMVVAEGSRVVVLNDKTMSCIGVGMAAPACAFIEMDMIWLPDGEVDEQTVLTVRKRRVGLCCAQDGVFQNLMNR